MPFTFTLSPRFPSKATASIPGIPFKFGTVFFAACAFTKYSPYLFSCLATFLSKSFISFVEGASVKIFCAILLKTGPATSAP